MVHIQADIEIQAPPRAILDVLADLPSYPQWSAVHKKAVVDEVHRGGRPQRATMTVAAAGLTDVQVLDYTWSANRVEWSLVHAGQQRDQHGSYDIASSGHGRSAVHYDLDITPSVPMPGFIVRRVMNKAVQAATAGLKSRVEQLQKQPAAS